jgi:hypothetical protein
MAAEGTCLAGWGSAGKTRTTAHRRHNARAAHRTMLGTGAALRRGVGWARFCKNVHLVLSQFYKNIWLERGRNGI